MALLSSLLRGLSPRGLVNRSGTSENGNAPTKRNFTCEANRHFVSIYDNRDLRFSAGVFKHFLKFVRVFLYIDIDGPITIGFPSLPAEGSGIGAVNNDLFGH